jgi:hypothetical protein
MAWTTTEVDFLRDNYPQKGRAWCAEQLGRTDSEVRNKAWRLGLKARGISEAWFAKNEAHAKILTGRKRPEQAEVLKALHKAGKLKKDEAQREAIGARVKAWIEQNGHPRGALGMKHTEESKRKISIKSSELVARTTDDQWLARTKKAMQTRERNGTQLPQRLGASWKAAWREIGGVRKFYRSRWEANYARYLQWLKECGQIQSWAHEPKTFWFEGIKRGCVSYLPDFCVVENSGAEAYHEVKGWMDDRSVTKIKRMAKYHPSVKLVVIDTKAYKEIQRKVSAIVPGWEE